ncbi:MAG: site-specific integrase [Sphingobacterium sp.]|nr:site-specific integrase [Sphingobacterium sp.]
MKSQHTFSILFFLKKDKASGGKAPLYARITVDGEFADVSLKERVEISAWNQKKQKLSGTDDDQRIKEKVRITERDINTAYDDLKLAKRSLSAETVKAKYLGEEEDKQVTLLWLIEYHNTEIGKLLTEGTMKNYRSTEKFIIEYIRSKRKTDLSLDSLDNRFIMEFDIFLRTKKPERGQKPCGNNTVMKHMERLKKMIGIALNNEWMKSSPFTHFKRKIIRKDREPLDARELKTFEGTITTRLGYERVKDEFLFSCYTGLGYAEMCNFKPCHIIEGQDGEFWIEMVRKKTLHTSEQKFFVFLLPEALALIEKYKDDPVCLQRGTVFPMYSNQTTNRYLKDIAKSVGIEKKVTFHVARHTFATTVTMENGVSIESVSAQLGHASIRTTQIYAKTKKIKVENEMKLLRDKKAEVMLQAV